MHVEMFNSKAHGNVDLFFRQCPPKDQPSKVSLIACSVLVVCCYKEGFVGGLGRQACSILCTYTNGMSKIMCISKYIYIYVYT